MAFIAEKAAEWTGKPENESNDLLTEFFQGINAVFPPVGSALSWIWSIFKGVKGLDKYLTQIVNADQGNGVKFTMNLHQLAKEFMADRLTKTLSQ